MPGNTNQRKVEHVDVIYADPKVDRQRRYFDDIQLIHRALPDINLADIDTRSTFLDKPIQFPLLIFYQTNKPA